MQYKGEELKLMVHNVVDYTWKIMIFIHYLSCILHYIVEPQNKEKEWDLLLHHSKFPLEYVKGLIQSLLKGSEVDQYSVQNLTWSGMYLRSTLSNDPFQRVLTLVPLTATGPEVYVATMTMATSENYIKE